MVYKVILYIIQSRTPFVYGNANFFHLFYHFSSFRPLSLLRSGRGCLISSSPASALYFVIPCFCQPLRVENSGNVAQPLKNIDAARTSMTDIRAARMRGGAVTPALESCPRCGRRSSRHRTSRRRNHHFRSRPRRPTSGDWPPAEPPADGCPRSASG